jgi:hypothetical protein
MNSISFFALGGSFARTSPARTRVGWPGAPGWTTTGAGGEFCADAGKDKNNVPATPKALVKALKRIDSIFEFIEDTARKITDYSNIASAGKAAEAVMLNELFYDVIEATK